MAVMKFNNSMMTHRDSDKYAIISRINDANVSSVRPLTFLQLANAAAVVERFRSRASGPQYTDISRANPYTPGINPFLFLPVLVVVGPRSPEARKGTKDRRGGRKSP